MSVEHLLTIALTVLAITVPSVAVWLWLRGQDQRLAKVRTYTVVFVFDALADTWAPSREDVHTIISVTARAESLAVLPTVDEVLEDVAGRLLVAYHQSLLLRAPDSSLLERLARVRTAMHDPPTPRLSFASSFLIGAAIVVVGMFLTIYLPAILHVPSPFTGSGGLATLVTQTNLTWDEAVGSITTLLGGGVTARLLAAAPAPRRQRSSRAGSVQRPRRTAIKPSADA